MKALRWLCAVLALATEAHAQVIAPRIIEAPTAELPANVTQQARSVPVLVVVAPDGSVTQAQVDAELEPQVAQLAIETARTYRFQPALRDGTPIAAKIRILVALVPAGAAAAPPSPEPSAKPEAQPSGDAAAPPPPARPPASPTQRGKAPAAPAPTAGESVTDSSSAQDVVAPGGDAGTKVNDRAKEVVVTGRRDQKAPASASEYHVDPVQFADVPRHKAEDLLTLAPGFVLANHGGELHPSTVYLRGFDAGEGQDIEFTVNGVPLNEVSNPHGHGYSDTHFIIPELVEELHVVEGPFDARQGDFAVAGSVHYHLGLSARGLRATAGYGSFDSKRLLLLWGPKGEQRGTFVGFEVGQGDGFGPNRAHALVRAMAGYERPLDVGTRLVLTATSYAGRFDSAGVVREDDLRARRLPCPASEDQQFFCTYDPNQGGAASRHSISAGIEHEGSRHGYQWLLFGTLRDLRLRENFTGFMTDFRASGEAQRGDGLEPQYSATTLGSRGHYAIYREAFGHRQRAEIGYFARHDRGSTSARRLRRDGGEPYKVVFDNGLRITNVGAYAMARVVPSSRLVLRAGLRVDAFSFGVTDRNRPAQDRQGERLTRQTSEAFGFAFQPKASAEFLAFRDWSVLASYGVGTRSSDAQALSDGEFAPFARVRAAEAGVVFRRPAPSEPSSEARLIAYSTHVDRDLIFDETTGRNVLSGASNRFGALFSGRVSSRVGLEAQGSVTYSEAYLSRAGSSAFELKSGPRMPYIPRWVLRADTAFRRPLRVAEQPGEYAFGLGFTYVGPRPLPLNEYGHALASVDLSGRLRIRNAELGVQVTNLFDRRNRELEYNYVSNFQSAESLGSQFPEIHFSAAPPRQIFGTLTLYWEDDS
ncbi:MAG TPA: TonB-dependent receptor [Polyangiaceae bacterium]|nr:TonB-dependent receptor [Polyangiaceae bacterium]